jgi:RNA polymerase sigma-70 factor (ECF subfamily)
VPEPVSVLKRSARPAAPVDPLVGAIRNRDGQALNQFLTKHRDRLADWVRFRLGVPSGRGADQSDALQDVSVKVWQSIGAFTGTTEAQLLGWFQQRLRWWVVDLSRRRVVEALHRQPGGVLSETGVNVLGQLPARMSSPSHLAVISEAESRIRDTGERLTNEQLTILTLHDIDGISLKEIARQFGVSPVEIAREYLIADDALDNSNGRRREASGSAPDFPRANLDRALAALPAAERRAVRLKHMEDFTMEETAAALETTPAAVGSAVYRGMKQLRQLLCERPGDGDADSD